VKEEVIVEFQRFYVKIGSQKYGVGMKEVLQALVQDLQQSPLSRAAAPRVSWNPYPLQGQKAEGKLTQDYLWTALGSFFRSSDLVIGETGTSAFGLCDSKLPVDVTMWNQTVYGSIGYATGAIVGAAQAVRESEGRYKRAILVTGEGSMQLTVQAISDMLRYDLKPIV